MSTLNQASSPAVFGNLTGAFKTFADEATALVQALLYPGKILAEVEQMRILLKAAHEADVVDPARAAALRAQAARVGLN